MIEVDYEECKSVEEYDSLDRDIKAEITDISLTVEQIIVLKLLHGLGSSFTTYSRSSTNRVDERKISLD